ncbi:hypothetical protein [Paraliomyxa miuraensis]|uniref:hypothetical protein n=1 Tax=Paraliomyxa miuraensis TaxID=376150 RepID=UPI00224EA02F|nr:hypothetical protein [Paraliomyxa miuraensis]MCX4239156.1 hypothetical protein [Paraliomyxa miuraensis]
MMRHHSSQSTAVALTSLWLFVAGCDAEAEPIPAASAEARANVEVVANVEADAAVETKIDAKDFDLEAVASVVEEGEIESAAELEVIINDEDRGINHIDIDTDGTIDHVQVVEVEEHAEADGDVVLELRVIPSSSGSVDAAIVFATTTFTRHSTKPEVEIRTRYTAVVHHHDVHVYTHVVPVKLKAGVVVDGSVFLSWVFAVDRSVYVGVYTVDDHGHWIPPGHLKHGHWKAKGHGHGKGDAVVIDAHGGGSTIHITSSSLGHGGHGGGKGGKGGKGAKGKGKRK